MRRVDEDYTERLQVVSVLDILILLAQKKTFVSSRSDCAKKNAAKPEDFMDEEDLQDIRDIQKIVDTTDEIMDFVTGKQAPLTTAFRSAMLPPTNESVGARILKKMGWRVGQGIGPRVTLKWKPDPERVWSQHQPQEPASSSNKENIKNDAANALPHGKWKTSGLSADARGSILGETPLPSAPRSVFDFMSQKDRERLKNIAASLHPPSAAESSTVAESTSQFSPTPTPTPTTATPRIPRIDPGIARAAINGFKPFATNPVNQARYTAYLQSQADPSSTITPEPLSINQCPNSTLRWTNMLRAISSSNQ
ncbi:hypothetical protein EV360DRAFT_85844 [Lentinula raphanica]|nr:hypothetical protein EV360DRAFT_85844 [Lentinula raphanica]